LGRYGKNAGSNDLENFGRVAKIWVDPKTTKPTSPDGYLNKRVAVDRADSGKMKRYWGAYAEQARATLPGDYDPKAPPAQQFRNPVHCVERANDGLVYVCDRQGDRVQVFQPDGKFVKEGFYAKETLASGSAWDIHVFKGPRAALHVPRRRPETRRCASSCVTRSRKSPNFGDGGRQAGQFYGVHSIATDSKGNLYTTRNVRRQARAEIRLQRHRCGSDARNLSVPKLV